MTPRQVRVARGGAATAVAVVLGAVSHTFGGGDAPAPLLVFAVALLAWPIGALLASPRGGLAGLAATALIAQAALHTVFAVTAGAAPAVTGHDHRTMTGTMAMPGTMPAVESIAPVLPDAPMLVAHLTAAAAAVLVLGYAERMLYAVVRWMVRTARRTAPVLAPTARTPRLSPGVPRPRLPRALLRAPLSRRGPPALLGVPAV